MITKEKLNELAGEIHQVNVDKGFWKDAESIITKSSLVISELYEMVEAHRKDRWCNINIDDFEYMVTKMPYTTAFEKSIKDTVEDELADTIIRCLDLHWFLYGEVMFLDPKVEQLDYDALEELDIKNNIEDLHTLILSLATVILAGIEYTLQPILLLCDKMGMSAEDILFHIEQKIKYNKTREKMHGKKY